MGKRILSTLFKKRNKGGGKTKPTTTTKKPQTTGTTLRKPFLFACMGHACLLGQKMSLELI